MRRNDGAGVVQSGADMPFDQNRKTIRMDDVTRSKGLALDLGQFPVELDMAANRQVAWFLLAFSLFWLAISGSIIFVTVREGGFFQFPAFLIMPVFLLIGGAILVLAIHLWTAKYLILLQTGYAEIARKNLFSGWQKKQVFYSDYQGVLIDTEIERRNKRSDITWQLINLVHEDTHLNIPLYKQQGKKPLREQWKQLATALNVPALQKDGDRVLATATGSLGKTLQEKAMDGEAPAIDSNFRNQPPPKGLRIWQENKGDCETLIVRINADRVS